MTDHEFLPPPSETEKKTIRGVVLRPEAENGEQTYVTTTTQNPSTTVTSSKFAIVVNGGIHFHFNASPALKSLWDLIWGLGRVAIKKVSKSLRKRYDDHKAQKPKTQHLPDSTSSEKPIDTPVSQTNDEKLIKTTNETKKFLNDPPHSTVPKPSDVFLKQLRARGIYWQAIVDEHGELKIAVVKVSQSWQ